MNSASNLRNGGRAGTAIRLGLVVAFASIACTKAAFQEIPDASGKGGTSAGGRSGGGSGGGRGGAGGTGGDGGTATIGTGGGGSGGGGTAGGAGGGASGTAGRGGSGGSAGGPGGTGGVAGSSGNGGRGGVGGGGTGGIAGSAGTAGRSGSGGSSGNGGTGGTGGTGGRPDAGTGVMPTVMGQIVITELMHDATVVSSDDLGEWFEVYNPSPTVTYDLVNCEVRDATGAGIPISISLVMPPMSFKVLAVSASPGFAPDFVYTNAVKFDNGGADRARIVCGGVEIDSFGYPPEFAGIGGRSFSVDPRHYDATENDIMANWCASPMMAGDAYNTNGVSTDWGTPGKQNSPCPSD